MATPARKNIIDNVITTLTAITTAGGYKTTVDTVARVAKDWASVGENEMPWLGIKVGKETFVYRSTFGLIDVKLPIQIVGHVIATSDTSRSEKLNNLLDDVIAALSSDPTRDNNAVTTTILGGETDEGDPDTADSRGGSGSFVLDVEIFYQRTTSSS